MKNGTCPRCESSNVFTKRSGISMDTTGVYVETSMFTSPSKTDDYICTDCGYFERYIADPGKLEDVAAKWAKIV